MVNHFITAGSVFADDPSSGSVISEMTCLVSDNCEDSGADVFPFFFPCVKDETPENFQKCAGMHIYPRTNEMRSYTHTHPLRLGMYSRNSWGGPVDPFILTMFPNTSIEGIDDPVISLIIFEWKDYDFIGAYSDSESMMKVKSHSISSTVGLWWLTNRTPLEDRDMRSRCRQE